MVGNDDAMQQRDATRETQEAMRKGTQRNAMTTTNTTTNRGAMGDDDNMTINDNAMQETATTRCVRGCYDKTRHDETRRDKTRRDKMQHIATQLQRHDGGGRWAMMMV